MVCVAMYVVMGLMAIFLLVVLINSFTGWLPSSPQPLVPVKDRTAKAKRAPFRLIVDGQDQAAATPPTFRRSVRRRRVGPAKIAPKLGGHVDTSEPGDLVRATKPGDQEDAFDRGDHVDASKPGDHVDATERGDHVQASKPGDHVDASERGDRVDTETSPGG
ncbi:hypothetical protein MTO96_037845 [Rhipicephalus appendiculatus]